MCAWYSLRELEMIRAILGIVLVPFETFSETKLVPRFNARVLLKRKGLAITRVPFYLGKSAICTANCTVFTAAHGQEIRQGFNPNRQRALRQFESAQLRAENNPLSISWPYSYVN